MTMSGRNCAIILIFGAFASIASPRDEDWVIHETKEKNAGNLKINLIRATSNKLYMEAMCDPSCKDIVWETMTFRYSWTPLPPPTVENLGYGHYVLSGLYSQYEYLVQARISGSVDRIRARTCSDHLGHLSDLQSRFNGPGWLDIRWKPFHSYDCKQDIEYVTRHKVQDGNFSEYRTYGSYPIDDKGTLHVGPSHPCDDWPKHFCLLITEGVEAGKNHTIEIQPQRIGGGEHDKGRRVMIVAYADPHNTQGAPDGGVHPDCQMWAWLAVGACLFCIAIIIGILVSALVTTYEKNQRLREEALNAENEDNENTEDNEETEETALTAGTTESRQSGEISETTKPNENKENK